MAAKIAARVLAEPAVRAAVRRLRRQVVGDAQERERALRERLAELERTQAALLGWLVDQRVLPGPDGPAGSDGTPVAAVADPRLAVAVARVLVNRGDALDAARFIGGGQKTDPALLRRLTTELEQRGYLSAAVHAAEACAARTGTRDDERVVALLRGEIAVMTGQFVPVVPGGATGRPVPGRVLHVVGTSLPTNQSGYTLRTHYTAMAQRATGIDAHVVTQMGFAVGGDAVAATEVDGVPYHRLPGPGRGAVPFDAWLGAHVARLADLVDALRPEVLHAASDFVNALAADVVGRARGIPVVYESRGFWEETWLSRQSQRFGWTDLDGLAARYGLPERYRWRRDIEDRLRRRADRVVTLSRVMVDRIEAGGVPREWIHVVPNAVDAEAFPVVARDEQLATRLGIGADAVVIGCVSSLVEYEGIDTLIAAYSKVRTATSAPVRLLVVGDGLVRPSLMRQAADLGLADALFPGQVPHHEVLSYYSLIDIFVLPRRPAQVCHLVTPLKPFEAFATGRAVVVSDVRALADIAVESAAAEVFAAGDADALAAVLTALVDDPARRRQLAQTGARWVRAERSWTANAQLYADLYQELAASGTRVSRPASVPPARMATTGGPVVRGER